MALKHEIRNQLQPIKTLVDCLENKEIPKEFIEKLIVLSKDSIKNILNLLENE